MSDPRKAALFFTVKYSSGRTRTVSLFPAADFPGGEGITDRYRCRVGRSWHMPGGQKYSFLTVDEAWDLALGEGLRPEPQPEPDLPVGSYVRVPSSWLAGQAQYTRTYTKSKPFQGVDGRWRVLCAFFEEPILIKNIVAVEVKKK
jgi:hypothetical protein